MYRNIRQFGVSVLGACSCLAMAHAAHAYNREVEIIVVDGSGTMTEPAKVSSGSTVSKWDEAFTQVYAKLYAQKNGVEKDSVGNPLSVRNHCVAVWVFAGNTYQQVYPLNSPHTSPWTPTAASMTLADVSCAADADHTASTGLYDNVIAYLQSNVQYNTSIEPQDEGPRTPLADALCAALHGTRAIQTAARDTNMTRRAVLFSDGLENQSSGECSGPDGTFVKDAKDASGQHFLWAGGTATDTWEYKTFNTAIFNQITPLALVSGADLNSRGLTETFEAFLQRVLAGGSSAVIQNRVAVDVYALYDFIPGQGNIPANLQEFYDELSQKSGGNSIRVAYNSHGVIGVPDPKTGAHPYENCLNRNDGDTDCSGVVGDADIYEVVQSDVWYLPVVLGYDRATGLPNYHELRNKADHNRDGFVDDLDLEIVLENYGM